MIEETAVVTRIDGGYVELEAKRSSSCGGCAAKATCGTGALSQVLGTRPPVMRVENTIGVRVGERVVVGLNNAALTKLSAIVYLVPLAGMIGGAILLDVMIGSLHPDWSEPAALVGGLLGLTGGFGWMGRHTRKLVDDARYRAVLLRRADEHPVTFNLPGVH